MTRKIVDIKIVRCSVYTPSKMEDQIRQALKDGWELRGDMAMQYELYNQVMVKYEEEKQVTSMNLHTVTFKLGKGTPKQFAEGLLDDNPAVLEHDVSIGRDSTWEATIIFDADKANTDFYRLLDWIKS